MNTHIIDGTQTAHLFLQHLQNEVAVFTSAYGSLPALAIIRVGNNPESALYVHHKIKTFEKCGFPVKEFWFDESISSSHLEKNIQALNSDPEVSGIIIQLPLPSHLSRSVLYSHVSPSKDVDGLTPYNQGKLLQSDPHGLFPCTPLGCFFILKKLYGSLIKKRVLMIGRSVLVGKPLALMCLDDHATITVAHSSSSDLEMLLKEADIIVSATGSARLVTGHHINVGACVLDVGISVGSPLANGKRQIIGDTDISTFMGIASYCTPVPGGIGPMTIALLAYNTLKAAYIQKDDFRAYDFQNYPDLVFRSH